MDSRILSLGEFNTLEFCDNILLSCGCDFDWLKIDSFNLNSSSISDVFNFNNMLNQRKTTTNTLHLQESLLILNQRNGSDFLKNPTNVYVSLISIPIWNESYIKDGIDYSIMHKDVKQEIEKLLDFNIARVYHCFEHCDLVLICDATKISFNEYIELLKSIRSLKIKNTKTEFSAILNIISIYAYKKDASHDCFSKDKNMSLTIELSLKEGKNIYEIEHFLTNESPSNISSLKTETIGYYDYIISWYNINNSKFNNILSFFQEHKDFFFSLKFHIGTTVTESLNQFCDNISYLETDNTNVSKCVTKVFEKYYDCLINSCLDEELLLAIKEIYSSIVEMTKRGYAQYYTLTFFESFFSFLNHLIILTNRYLNNPKNEEEDEYNKKILETIFDMYTKYFGFLNSLNACAIHSQRRFLQVDSYQMLYYNASPKLLSFYTAIASKIVQALSIGSSNTYTFLITPDFKKDIFVESITDDRTIESEHNILIIHMSEESMYNIKSTLTILAHEIFHHIGQNKELRFLRSQLCIKSCIARVLSQIFSISDLKGSNNEEKYLFFTRMVDNFYKEIFISDRFLFPPKEYEKLELNFTMEECLYYSDYLISAFTKYFATRFKEDSTLLNALKNTCANKYDFTYDSSIFQLLNNELSPDDTVVLKEFSLQTTKQKVKKSLFDWILNNNSDENTYSIIQYVFRECYADLRMLMLSCNSEDRTSFYRNIPQIMNISTTEDVIRKQIIINRFASKKEDLEDVNSFKEKCLNFDNPEDENSVHGMFYLYLFDSVGKYLNKINETKSPKYLKMKNDFINIFSSLDQENIDIFIENIDKEIFDYRKHLIKLLDDIIKSDEFKHIPRLD